MATEKPSIVIVSIDALRADCVPSADESPHLRSLGLRPPAVPELTRLVQGSCAFSQAIACSSYTTACHGSLFTGLVPAQHGVRSFSATSLNSQVRTLAEIARDAGYATCAMTDQPIFFQQYGLQRGFQVSVASEQEALSWWDSYESMPRLLFMHLWDIHRPYAMPFAHAYRDQYPAIVARWEERLRSSGLFVPSGGRSRFEDPDRYNVGLMQVAWHQERGFKTAMEDYLAGVELFDSGRLRDLAAAFRSRQIPDSALMVITADHGEGRDFPPSRLARHGTTLKDDQIRIPLFMSIPGLKVAPRLGDQVSQADIAPTILDAVHLLHERTEPGSVCDGRSLLPLLHGASLPERPVYAETSTVFKDPALSIDDPAARRDPTLRYRILRYPDRKYWLVGKPVVWDEALLASAADTFVRTLFLNVLGRRPGQEEEEQWLAQVEATLPDDLARRRALVQRFEGAGEFKRLPKYTMFDLTRDPLEVKPRDARQNRAEWAAYQEQLTRFEDIERRARAGEPLISNEADEQIILARLQDLGYVE